MTLPTLDRQLDIPGKLVRAIADHERRLKSIETQQQVTYIYKTTSGDPSTGATGQFVENTVDQTLKVWAGGAWRLVVSWAP